MRKFYLLLNHSWPGNVRELHNTLIRAYIWAAQEIISADDIRESLEVSVTKKSDSARNFPLNLPISLEKVIGEVARDYLTLAMDKTYSNKTKAAELLGFSNYQTLSNWLKKYKIE
jgi:DNA-binding NtrC family response regulator